MGILLGTISALETRLAKKQDLSGHDWFKTLTPKQQADYVRLHPDSKYAPGSDSTPEPKKKKAPPKPVMKDVKGPEPGDKDHKRMQDIVTKGKGDHTKMISLVNQMANAITDKDKALRRGEAAYHNLPPEIAHEARSIFHERAKYL